MKQLGQLASYCNVRGTLTAPVGVKVSVEVDPDAAAALADRAVLPPHSVLRQKKVALFTTARSRNNTGSVSCILTVVHVYWYPSGFITGRM